LPDTQLITIDMTGKDPIAAKVENAIKVNEEQYAREYLELLARTQMPAQSWSFVGKWMVAKACQARVLFTGLGADELFGGYGVYQTINYDQSQSHSPYSKHGDPAIWQKCLDVYSGDPQQATLLMDYWYQVIGCDAPGLDRIGGAWGIETRNPFLSRRIMEFALNLPWQYKVNTTTKPILRQKYLQYYPEESMLPKQGFAGHANDALPWLGVDIVPTGNRYDDWKQIARRTFYANRKN
jgi:asparagine synthetase B (glutamine-hydrolysing)